ncbi:hypothetical protein [Bradyrhizobium elkanii]|uniref:Uncharacterized protein n=1 Tax=Bradyrhizobium elkanii TaxID=29448 RepID=A0A8I1YFY1_BRAEL|nr:hypothetical protein [Bradyrhizobium elkanii]MBP1297476.1 hypothetical protein [Bradyrhizobium elkanii]
MIGAGDENKTHHFRGKWFGFGPVQDSEALVFAVFATTKTNGQRLSAKSFDRQKLVKAEQSIARQSVTTRKTFKEAVVRTGEASKGNFIGVATASAGTIRAIFSNAWPAAAPREIRGFGVLDLVEKGDFDGHGTVGFRSEATLTKPRELGALREFLMFDLADKFSDIGSIDECPWGSLLNIGLKRALCIWQAVGQV